MRVVGGAQHTQRPTILGRSSLFNRYGEEEQRALMEFQFLESFPSQTDIGMGTDLSLQPCGIQSYFATLSHERTNLLPSGNPSPPSSPYPRLPHLSNPYVRPVTELKDLRSSEPCRDVQNYPLSSVPRLDEVSVGPSLQEETSCAYSISNRSCPSQWSRGGQHPGGGGDSFSSFRKHSNVRRFEASDDNKLPNPDVPLEREIWPARNCCKELSEKNVFLNARQSHFDKISSGNVEAKVIPARENVTSFRLSKSKIPMKKEDEIADGETCFLNSGREETAVDTTSLNNVKATIQKLNSRALHSGKPFKNISSSSNFSGSRLHSTFGHDEGIFSAKKCPNEFSFAPSQSENIENCTKDTPSNNKCPSLENSSSSSSSKRTPKIPGSNLLKRLSAYSLQSSALPPKGAGTSASSPRLKERTASPSSSSRLLPPTKSGPSKAGLKSPRLPRFKLGWSRPDPLENFSGKSLCDSGSSECSDKGVGGRLSISDSCAEIFSPNESGDEVFHRLP